ncbi:MAG: hypothetical protein AAF940_03010 [Pseudomonadota bacterium]
MRRIFLAACISAAVSATAAITPVKAAPINTDLITAQSAPVVLIDGGRQRESLSDHNKKFNNKRHYKGYHPHVSFGFNFHSGHVYFRGHRGYRHARKGYVFYNGYYFPRYVVRPRVIYKPRIIHPVPVIRLSAAHIHWCSSRYKTYRRSDNTFAYKINKRTQCRSPYSG